MPKENKNLVVGLDIGTSKVACLVAELRADGSLEKYDKRHLLPFGEALPLGSRYRWIQKIEFGQANFQPGPKRSPLTSDGVAFTPLICFESVFPDLCRDGVREGSELFVNITNDGWFGDTPGPYQHAQMAIVRAVEFRRWLVRSANSGVSMVVAPTGQVVEEIGLYKEGILTTDVTLLSGETFYARHGEMPLVLACFILAGIAAVLSRRASTERCRKRSSSYSFKLPFNANSRRSLLCRGVYTIS